MEKCARFRVVPLALAGLVLAAVLQIGCSTTAPAVSPPPAAPAAVSPAAGARPCATAAECKKLMLGLAYAADLSASLTGTHESIETTTARRIACLTSKTPELSGWSLVWGPVVKLAPELGAHASDGLPETPINTLAVLHRPGSDDYVVAVAGTNAVSVIDWVFEDFDITPEPWPYGTGDDRGYVTRATLDGLRILLALEDDSVTLADYLATVTGSPGVTVTVTGHSLGGALAPALGLWLADTQGQAGGWDPQSTAEVAVYSFAGATPGDQHFAAYLNGRLPGDDLVVIDNTNDVVPHAWNLETLAQIQTLYPLGMRPVKLAPAVVGAELLAQAETKRFDDEHPGYGFTYTRLGTPEQQQPVTAAIVPASKFRRLRECPSVPAARQRLSGSKELTASDVNFLVELLYQHVCGYPMALDFSELPRKMATCSTRYR